MDQIGRQDTGDENTSEWTRLRILEDCEVNGVRFPKTVIIDVKNEDAAKLIENGNAELIEEKPAEAAIDADAGDATIATDNVANGDADADTGDGSDVLAVQTDKAEAAAPSTAEAETAVEAVEDLAADAEGAEDNLSELAATLAEPADNNTENELSDLATALTEPEAQDDTDNDAKADGEDGKTRKEAFIEAPSAAEVTAALEALGAGDTMDLTAVSPSNADTSAAASIEDTAADSEESKDGGDASGGWFEAQQNAEAASKSEPDTSADGSTSDENDDETESDK